MPHRSRPGDELAGRYRLVDLLLEAGEGRFWKAYDSVLRRKVALTVLPADNPRADALLSSAKACALVTDPRILRVLDAKVVDGVCYVVSEWGSGVSLDAVVGSHGSLGPRRSSWLTAEVADTLAIAYRNESLHGRLIPENVLIDRRGEIRLIGFGTEAALFGEPTDRSATEVIDLVGLLYFSLTSKWGGISPSSTPQAPREYGQILRPRRVRNGVPRILDQLCDDVLHPHQRARHALGDTASPEGIAELLRDFLGDPTGLQEALLASCPGQMELERVVLPEVPEFQVNPSDLDESVASANGSASSADEATEASPAVFNADDHTWSSTEPDEARVRIGDSPGKPLFAPEPDDGAPVRNPRDRARDTQATRFPWQATGAPSPRPVPKPTPAEQPPERATEPDEPPPGRNWLRLAAGVALALTLGLVVIVTLALLRGPGDGGLEPSVLLEPVDIRALGPEGPFEEEPDNLDSAADGDSNTQWTTPGFSDQLGEPARPGVGLTMDLGERALVDSVLLRMPSSATDVSLYVTDEAPRGVAALSPVAEFTVRSRSEVRLDGVNGQYVTVWLTKLPEDDEGFRGAIREVVVRGRREPSEARGQTG